MAAGLKYILKLLYPPGSKCLCCGELRLTKQEDCMCDECIAELNSKMSEHSVNGLYLSGIYAPFYYETPARQLIRSLKYSGIKAAAVPLGRAMAQRILSEGCFGGIVPIPLHKSRQRMRGFNQAVVLAEQIAEHMDIPVFHALQRNKKTNQQARLNKDQRHSNVENAFACIADVAGKRLLLIDDVCTSGSTAESCAEILLSAGAAEVCLCVAALAQLTGNRSAD